MRKIWRIAVREYLAMVYTKGFLVGLLLAPIIFLGGVFVPRLLMDRVDLNDKRIVVLDRTGELFNFLLQAADERNNREIIDQQTGNQTGPRYVLERGAGAELDDQRRLELSSRVRRGEIKAFVEIPPHTLGYRDTAANPTSNSSDSSATKSPPQVRFYAENAALSDERRWLERTINQVVRRRRLQKAGLDPAVVQHAIAPVSVESYRPLEESAAGRIKPKGPVDRFASVITPVVVMMLMFMIIFMAVQPALECVFEEKQNRIAEVLLGSVNSMQLMTGKLIGVVSGSLTTLAVYLGAGLTLAWLNGNLDSLPLKVLPWFLIFELLAVVMYTAIFMAVGAATGSAQEAQGVMIVLWLPLMAGFFAWLNIAREPNGALATGLSFFPPCTAMIMVLRLTVSDGVPPWQTVAAVILLLCSTGLCIFAAGRIFRIGILAQGKAPGLGQMLRWVVRD